jgi:hypothetical protein
MAFRAPRVAFPAGLAALLALAAPAVGPSPPPPPTAADKDAARTLMDRGWDRLDAKDFAAALKAFEGADAIMHVPVTGVAVARAQAALGMLLEARDTALQVTHVPAAPGESPAFAQARAEAKTLADQLEPRIPSLQIQLSATPAGLVVTVDGATVPPAALDVLRRVDPGKHVVAARAPGFAEAHVEVTTPEGARVPVPLTLVPAASTSTSGAPPLSPLPPPLPPSLPPVRQQRSGGVSPLVFVGFGVGGASLAAAAITGGLSLNLTAKLSKECPDKACPSNAHGDLTSANTLANVANVTFAVGVAGAVTGVIGLVLGRSPPTTVQPVVGAGRVGLAGNF